MSFVSAPGAPVRRVEPVWGTVISVDVREAVDPCVIDGVFAWFARVDDLFSTWRDDTEISRIGRGELEVEAAAAEVREVLARCEQVRAETDGAFDATFGARAKVDPRPGLAAVDVSGFVKGWAVERAAQLLEAAGAERFCINAGGDVLVRSRAGDSAWRVGIQHPSERDKVALTVGVGAGAIATSGPAERGDHVFDPRTGRPARGLLSATVIGPDLGRADALATALIADGSIEARWVAAAGLAAMVITDDHNVVSTSAFAAYRLP